MSRQREQTAETIPELIRQWAEATPDAPALTAPERTATTYGTLHEQTVSVARQLARSGIGRSDRVALVHANGPELAAAFLAVSAAAVCAPLNTGYRLSELEFYFSHLGATAVMLEEGASPLVRRLAEQRGLKVLDVGRHESGTAGRIELASAKAGRWRPPTPDDTALVLHTSGTTARPKIVPLSHRVLTLSAANIARTLALGPGDRCLNVMPLFHIHGLVGALLASLHAGSCVGCAPGFQAPAFHGWLSELEPTWYTAVPTMHQAVLSRLPVDVVRPVQTSLRFIRSSSSPLPPLIYDELEAAFGVPVIEAYGMTEAAHQVTSNPLPPAERRRGSVGLADHLELAVLDEDGGISSTGTGEVVIRGETVLAGYESDPEANAAAFLDGWFRTGDQGYVDDDGYVTLIGRTKEIVNRAGEKIAPAEIEDVLLSHPDVVQAVSFAVPDARLGEVVGAAVVPRAGTHPTERELQGHVASRLADFKVPSVVLTVDEVPLGPTGKLQRIGLAERLGLAEVPAVVERPPFMAPRSELEREIAAVWASTLDIETVGVDDDFFTLGGDSILGAEVVARLAELTGRQLPLTTLMWAPTLGEFTALIEEGAWDDDARIVPVRTEGSRTPLFVIHGLWDEVLNIGVLKRTLSEDQPLYAIRIVPHRFDYRSVEDMAGDYLREIQAVQPSGPYLFASMCSGGLIVAELTRQAHEAGVDIALAAVIDPRSDMGQGPARHYVHQAIQHVHEGTFGFAVRRKLRHWLAHAMPRTFPDPELEINPLRPTLYSLRRHYRLRRIPGTFTVVSTMDYKTPRSYWEERADRVAWYEVDAPHHTIFQQPHADALGEVLADVLRDVEAREEAA